MSDALTPVIVPQGSTALDTPQSLAALAPVALAAMLERRYLTDFDHAAWNLTTREEDNARPLLHEIVGLGRSDGANQAARVMQNVLTACHEPGHALVSVLHGAGDRCRLHIGARRLMDGGARSTEDYLDAQSGAFKAYLPGLQLGPAQRMDAQEMPELTDFLNTAPVLGAVTGVPANRLASIGDPQSIERLVRAAGGRRYALMIVAEAIPPWMIDHTIDALRQLKSEVHSLVRQTRTDTKGATRGVTRTEGMDHHALDVPMGLLTVSFIAQVIGALPLGLSGLGVVAGPAQAIALIGRMRASDDPNRRQVSEGATWSEGLSVEVLDENARACELLIERHLERLVAARSSGWWQSAVYVAGENEAALHSVFGALRSLYGGDTVALDPIRAIRLPGADLRPALQYGRLVSMTPRGLDVTTPAGLHVGAGFDVLGTCVNSAELATMVSPPHEELPGLPTRRRPPFALTAPGATDETVALGALLDHLDRPIAHVGLSRQALNGHVFVSGVTGSGKTNTCMRVLIEAYEKWGVPFLVVEPAKAEYRALAAHPALKQKLRVYTVGVDSPLPLRINPFTLVPGVPLLRHIDRFKAIFNAAFPMFAGMSYILEDAILEIYQERGWNIYTSQNPFLPPRASVDERAALTPSLEDLYHKIDVVLARRKYGQEIEQNLGASLRSRLNSLMIGGKGMILNTRRGTPLEDLFSAPAVIELENLGDEEEKAFVMAILFVLLCENAESRKSQQGAIESGQLHHLTLIEEAHRLLAHARGGGGAETADPRGKAVSMFTDMLAEMRAYGEGFIIADQIPTKIAPEVMKNSNTRIIHKLPAPDDRRAIGQCANLNEEQIAHLNTLATGVVALQGMDVNEATLVQVANTKDALTRAPAGAARPAQAGRREARQLHRHAACEPCASPCRFFPMLSDMRADHAGLNKVFDRVLLQDAAGAWAAWTPWRAAQQRNLERALGREAAKSDADARGVNLCSAIHAAQTWLGDVLEARNRAADEPAGMNPDQRLARERAGKALSVLIADWLKRANLDAAARTAFAEASAALEAAFAGAPIIEAPGCAACPARCRMASFAAPHLEALRLPLARALSDSGGALAKVAQLERAMLQSRREGPALDAAREHALLYCAVTQLAAKHGHAESAYQDLLTELAAKAAPAAS